VVKDNKDFFKIKNRWSEIKDQLLGCYLTPYFQKMLTTKQPIFYVDCFAGKGKFDDGKPGSPVIALKARDACLDRTTQRSGKIEMCFIDLNHAEELNLNLTVFASSFGMPLVISGKYENEIEKLLSKQRGKNVFLYIDPYGIKALDSALFDKFKSFGFKSLEMLINFNSFGFFRDACRTMKVDFSKDEAFLDLDDLVEYAPTSVRPSKQSEDLLTSIAGGDYWKAIVHDFQIYKINGYQAEKRFSAEYKQRLQKRYTYVLDMPIRLKAGQRPKYRMIHVCDHEDGCYLMAQNMQKRKDDLFLYVQQEGRYTLFDNIPSVSTTLENEVVTFEEIKTLIKEQLLLLPNNIGLTKLLATFVNNYGLLCEFKMIYNILEEMEKVGSIKIIRTPALTKYRTPSKFWEEKKGQTIVINRIRS